MAGRNPRLGSGVHLVLTSGPPVSPAPRIPLLVGADGRFRHGFLGLWRLLAGTEGAAAADQVRRELDAQCQRAVDAGLRIDHLDGHRHVQMIPRVWLIAAALARQLGCGFVRVSSEEARPLASGSPVNALKARLLRRCARALPNSGTTVVGATGRVDQFIGVLDAGRMDRLALVRALREVRSGVCEISSHPSFAFRTSPPDSALTCAAEDTKFLRSSRRHQEADALVDEQVRRAVTELGIELTTFGELNLPAARSVRARAAC